MSLSNIKFNEAKLQDFIALGLEDAEHKLRKWRDNEREALSKQLFFDCMTKLTDVTQETLAGNYGPDSKFEELLTGLLKLVRSKDMERTKGRSASVASSSMNSSTFTDSEKETFVRYINDVLKDDKDLKDNNVIPIDPAGSDIFDAIKDGILLCKLVNAAVPGTLDERIIHTNCPLTKFQKFENLNNALQGARAMGCNVVNINSQDLADGRPALVLALLWQILHVHLLATINVTTKTEVLALQKPEESLSTFITVPNKELLLRWVNYHLARFARDHDNHNHHHHNNNNSSSSSRSTATTTTTTTTKMVENYHQDFRDGHAYLMLLQRIAPELVTTEQVRELIALTDDAATAAAAAAGDSNNSNKVVISPAALQRARFVVDTVKKVNPRIHMDPEDIVTGSPRLNLVFLARIFDCRSGLFIDSFVVPSAENSRRRSMTKLSDTRKDVLLAEAEKIRKTLPQLRPAYLTAYMNLADLFQAEATQQQERCTRLEAELEQFKKKELTAKNNEINNLNEEINRLRQRLEQKRLELEHESAARRADGAIILECQQKQAMLLKQIEQLEADKAKQTSEMNEMRRKLKDKKEELELTRSLAVDERKKMVEEDQKNMVVMQKKLADRLAQIRELEEKAELDRETIAKLEHQIQKQQEALDQALQENQIAATKMKELLTKLVVVQDFIKVAKDDFNFVCNAAGGDIELQLARRKFPAGVSPDQILYPEKKGFMCKPPSSGKKGAWKRRFFVLKDNYLFYYEKETSTTPSGLVRLDDAEVNFITDPSQADNRAHCLRITATGKELTVQCEDEKEQKAWHTAIKKASITYPLFAAE